jgi:hypothetical protein
MTPSSVEPTERHDTFGGNCHDTPEADTVIAVTVKSGKGTARQTIRMDEDLWAKLDEAATALGTDRSSYLRDFARWAVHEKGAKMPRRPSAKPAAKVDE